MHILAWALAVLTAINGIVLISLALMHKSLFNDQHVLIEDIHNFWRFWSVQLGVLSGAFGVTALAYAGIYAIAPPLVAGLPAWFGTGVTAGATFCAFAGVYARRWSQPALPYAPPSELR
jgi:hypothetical protein